MPSADLDTGLPPARMDAGSDVPAPRAGWGAPLGLDHRGWMVVGGIAAVGALVGAALGRDVHWSPLVPLLLVAAIAVSAARAGWSWLCAGSRRARLRESALSRVEQYGGGVYGTGAGITLLVLSAASLREEWARADGALAFLRGMSLDWWMGFSGESIANAVQAGMWPIHWYTNHGLAAALAVGAAAWAGDALADRWRREPLPRADAQPAPAEPESQAHGTPAVERIVR